MNPELLQTITQKLETELSEVKNHFVPIQHIKDYLLKACVDNDYLADMLLTPNRTLTGCSQYLEKQVRQILNNQNGNIPDAEIYAMVEDFYYFSDDEITALLTPPVKAQPMQKSVAPSKKPQKIAAKKQPNAQLNLFDAPNSPSPEEISADIETLAANEEVVENEQEIA